MTLGLEKKIHHFYCSDVLLHFHSANCEKKQCILLQRYITSLSYCQLPTETVYSVRCSYSYRIRLSQTQKWCVLDIYTCGSSLYVSSSFHLTFITCRTRKSIDISSVQVKTAEVFKEFSYKDTNSPVLNCNTILADVTGQNVNKPKRGQSKCRQTLRVTTTKWAQTITSTGLNTDSPHHRQTETSTLHGHMDRPRRRHSRTSKN